MLETCKEHATSLVPLFSTLCLPKVVSLPPERSYQRSLRVKTHSQGKMSRIKRKRGNAHALTVPNSLQNNQQPGLADTIRQGDERERETATPSQSSPWPPYGFALEGVNTKRFGMISKVDEARSLLLMAWMRTLRISEWHITRIYIRSNININMYVCMGNVK